VQGTPGVSSGWDMPNIKVTQILAIALGFGLALAGLSAHAQASSHSDKKAKGEKCQNDVDCQSNWCLDGDKVCA
jgi:hypothetical protein